MLQSWKQNKSPEVIFSIIQVYYLSDREFKIIIMKMLNKVRNLAHEENKNSTKTNEPMINLGAKRQNI